MRFLAVFLIILTVPAIVHTATLKVPSQYPTIQDAIDAAVNRDTVLVAPGTYNELIDFLGKAITVISEQGAVNTVIDGYSLWGSIVTCQSGEGPDSVLDGFTLTNGDGGFVDRGGGIYCDSSSPTIMNNSITQNHAFFGGGIGCLNSSAPLINNNTIRWNSAKSGGGIYCIKSSPMIMNSAITENIADGSYGGGIYSCAQSFPTITGNTISANWSHSTHFDGGGGIYCGNALITHNIICENWGGDAGGGGIYCTNATITNNIIYGNSGGFGGGGINCTDASITNNLIYGNEINAYGGGIYGGKIIANNTIIGNKALNDYGGGIYCGDGTVTNTILWNNTASTDPEISGNPTVTYCDVKGGWPGTGNIDADPLFVSGPKGFYYLSQVVAGQPADSPCVDTGSDLAGNLGMDIYWTRTDEVPDSGMVDMGFHYGPFKFPRLQTDTFNLSKSTGGEAGFILLAGTSNANRNYIFLGSVSGTSPGIPLPGGKETLPLNWDIFTILTLLYANTPIFQNFIGITDSGGSGGAKLVLGILPPGSSGITMHFAYALNNPWDFVSNPVGIEIVP